jgi:hypothetical protein
LRIEEKTIHLIKIKVLKDYFAMNSVKTIIQKGVAESRQELQQFSIG